MDPDLDLACHLNVVAADPDGDGLEEALAALAELGYRRVVLPPIDPAPERLGRLARAFASAGLVPIPIAGQGPGADVSSPDAAERAAGEQALRAMVEATAALGGDQLNGVPYGPFGPAAAPVDPAARERAARAVGRVADQAHGLGVTVTFEVLNRYETAMVNTAADAMAFAEASGSPHLRIHLDTFHMAIEEADMVAAVRTALPRLGYLELGQSGRGALSRGAVDVAAVVCAALDEGYRGRWGVEAFTRPGLAEPVADMLKIWRTTYDDGLALAADAVRVIRSGWSSSTVGRRAARLARSAVDA